MSADFTTFAASFAQRRLWFLQMMSPESCAYNMVFRMTLPFTPDAGVLQESVDTLVARHEALRTCFDFANGEPVQQVYGQGKISAQVFGAELSGTEFAARVAATAAEPFQLSQLPLCRVLAHRAGDASLALVMHHSIADGETIRILVEELLAIYQARVAGQVLALPPLQIQYADYADWQRRALSGARLQRLRHYWLGRLDGLTELALFHDGAPSGQPSAPDGALRFRISAPVVSRMRALAGECRVTLFASLLAAFSALLARFTGQTTLAIGTPVSGRTRAELARVAGLFVNSLVFRADVDASQSFADLVRETGRRLAEDLARQEMPFEEIVEALGARRRADRNPVFQVMIQLQAGGTAAGSEHAGFEPERVSSQLDLSLIQYERDDGSIDGWAVYAASTFSPAFITQLLEGYQLVLEAGSRQPGTTIADLPILTEERKARLSALGAGTLRHWPAPHSLGAWLSQRAASSAEELAVVEGDTGITFRQLDARAESVAAALGAPPGSLIALTLPRSIDLVVAIAGVLKAGCAFLYLDPQAPALRNRFILSDSRASHLILPGHGEDWSSGIEVQRLRLAILPQARFESPETVAPDQAAYVIYTSGTTGEPKGVVIPQRAIVNHMRWMLERFPMTPRDRILQRTPLTFDASVWELLAPLLSGATMVLAAEQRQFDPAPLLATIRSQHISVLQVVPSLLRALVAHGGLAECVDLKWVFCGGEALSRALCSDFFAQSQATLCNLYGPTETTIDATFHVLPRESVREKVSIGRPVDNVSVRVLDARRSPLPAGVVGELYIGGDAVGTGYLNRPELTLERFVADPTQQELRLFRTGDRVRMGFDGELEYLGRIDDQVKLRGFRIELAEIDSMLAAHPLVAEAASVVQNHGDGDQRLIAFCTSSENTDGLETQLQAWLRSRLPAHAVPSIIRILAALPKSVHGKVDRAALARQIIAPSDGARPGPRSPLERAVCEAFGAALHLGEVSIDDDFFLLGGHSLLVIGVCDALTRACETPVSVVDVYEHPTPRQLAAAIEARTQVDEFTVAGRLTKESGNGQAMVGN